MLTVRTARRVSGFSLVEVMIAIGAFSIVLLSSVSSISFQQNFIRKSEERIYVEKILESRLEEIRDLTFANVEALAAEISFAVDPIIDIYGNPINPAIVDSSFQIALTNATGTVYVDTIDANLKQISAEISWTPALSSYQVSMELTTYICRNGIHKQ